MKLRLRPAAVDDVDATRAWYRDVNETIMVRFEDAISTTFERIVEAPFTFPVVHRDVRRALVRTFPYGVFFRVQGDEVAVVAVMHLRRHGRAWQGRR